MSFKIGFLLKFSRYFCVDSCRGKVGVAENMLNSFKVHPVFKEMGGNCVPQGVRCKRDRNPR